MMSSALTLKRLSKLFNSNWGDVGICVFVAGLFSEDAVETKSVALQQWLFGQEFADFAIIALKVMMINFIYYFIFSVSSGGCITFFHCSVN
jgi:hypothetical protein